MMEEKEYADEIILLFRQKYQEGQSEHMDVERGIFIGENRVSLHRVELLNGCSMILPDTFTDMKYVESAARYWKQNRPQIMKEIPNQDAFLTFHAISANGLEMKEDIVCQMEKVRNDMKKIQKQNVFYDTGKVTAEKLEIAWMDFKTFCQEGSLYCMLFLFYAEEQMIVGNFHCTFPQYDSWKPVMLKLLTTVQV